MKKYYYLINLQYLGFRYRGWFKQQNQLTVQGMVEKTLKFVLGHTNFKTLGASRTDAKVSANEMHFELFLQEELTPDTFLPFFDKNLPSDIRAVSMRAVDSSFNIIQSPKEKEYLYLFSFGEKAHPFSTSMMASFEENLDLETMKAGAKLFEGIHNFKAYCAGASGKQQFERKITYCRIEKNTAFTASFFPDQSYLLRVKGSGFLRYQIRLMMGQLIRLGSGEISLTDIEKSLADPGENQVTTIAPGSGLILNKTIIDTDA